MTSYVFKKEDGKRFIINAEYSGIGYCYPRIFVEGKDGYVNIDVTVGVMFNMSKEDFESWLDGAEVADADISSVCKEVCVNKDVLLSIVNDL